MVGVLRLPSTRTWSGIPNTHDQLYTRAVAERPGSQLVSLCDVNEERMKYHNNMLKELGRPQAKMYAGVRRHVSQSPCAAI